MEKYIRIVYIWMLAMCIPVLHGCEDYFDLNENPNLVQAPPINALLTTVTHKTGLTSRNVANIVSNYTQYLASPTQASALDTYQITDQTTQWDQVYLAMADIFDMRASAQELNATEHLGVANILLAYNLALITDVFGAAPLSEAFVGILNPVYDSEEAIYNRALELLQEGITALRQEGSAVRLGAEQDLIHGGDVDAWIKTGYAIQARYLNKISKKSSYDPSAVLTAVENSYTSNADDAGMAVFVGVNPWAQVAISNAGALLGGWLSENFVNHLNGITYGLFDPRIEKITDLTIHDEYVGTPNGGGNQGTAPNTVHDECYISVNSPLTSRDSPLWIVTYAEIKFVEAEAALRNGDSQRAYAAYLEGIRANMEKLEVEGDAANAYIDDSSVSVGAANLTLGHIFKEKYVATYLNAEAWNDIRRHDYQYTDFKMPLNVQLDTFIRRMAYPVGELSKNGANVPDEVPLSTKLWWDQP